MSTRQIARLNSPIPRRSNAIEQIQLLLRVKGTVPYAAGQASTEKFFAQSDRQSTAAAGVMDADA